MKNSTDTIGNRTRDLPVCSAVPQTTALPRAPNINCMKDIPMTYVSLIMNDMTGSEKKKQEALLSY